ncbi:hypothetical protein [Prescottella equi]|nr:hypothetical protein [Prescottella equi]
MALTDITRASVLTAIDENDALGREAFLEKYGLSSASTRATSTARAMS